MIAPLRKPQRQMGKALNVRLPSVLFPAYLVDFLQRRSIIRSAKYRNSALQIGGVNRNIWYYF